MKVKGIKKYAKQFLSTVDLKEVPQAIEQLSAIARLMDKDKNFKTLMISPIFRNEERQETIAHISRLLGISDIVSKYIGYLSDERAIGALDSVVKSITAMYLDMKKKARVVVTSPVQIGKEFEGKLIESLKELTRRDVELEHVLDPSLLGGIRIKVGSTMYDSSIKGQLGLLRDKLLSQ